MLAAVADLAKTKDLVWEWTARNVRARYQQSVLGWLWAIVQPAAQVAIFAVVFKTIVPVDTGNTPYVLFSYVALVPWTLLAMSLPDMANSLVDNLALVTKIYFPREALPVAALLARLLDFAVAAVLIVVLMIAFQVAPSATGWLFLPGVLAIELMLILGLGLMCAALNVFVRDVRSLLTLGLQVWFYASPVLYPTSLVPAWLRPYYFLNPMAGVLTAVRDILLEGGQPGPYLVPAALVSAFVLIAGWWIFTKVEYQFADRI